MHRTGERRVTTQAIDWWNIVQSNHTENDLPLHLLDQSQGRTSALIFSRALQSDSGRSRKFYWNWRGTGSINPMWAGLVDEPERHPWRELRSYLYLVVSREQHKQDPKDQGTAVLVRETEPNNVIVYRETDAKTQETRLDCHSEQKAKKEQPIRNRFHARLEEALAKLHAGLNKQPPAKAGGCLLK